MATAEYTIRRRRIKGKDNKLHRSKIGFKITDEGSEALFDLADAIKQDIRNIITAQQGAVYGLPLFGVDYQSFLFEPAGEEVFNAIAASIQQQVNNQYPVQITVAVKSNATTKEDGKVIVPLEIRFNSEGQAYSDLISLKL